MRWKMMGDDGWAGIIVHWINLEKFMQVFSTTPAAWYNAVMIRYIRIHK